MNPSVDCPFLGASAGQTLSGRLSGIGQSGIWKGLDAKRRGLPCAARAGVVR